MNLKNIKEIKKISEIDDHYNFFLIDLWGVIHNGIKLFPTVVNVLENFKLKDKNVFFITNAPRRAAIIEKQLSNFGLSRELYSGVISSGEMTWIYLFNKYKNRNIDLLHIGPPRDNHLIEGLSYKKVSNPSEASIIVNTGPWGDDDTLDNYKNILDRSLKYNLPMICSNPDKEVIRGEKFMICAGKLAEYYEDNGGRVKYFGKPYEEIYDFIFDNNKLIDKDKTLVIGDSLENDIRGANLQNCDSLLISNGIHRSTDDSLNKISKNIYNLIALKKIYPNFISYKLC